MRRHSLSRGVVAAPATSTTSTTTTTANAGVPRPAVGPPDEAYSSEGGLAAANGGAAAPLRRKRSTDFRGGAPKPSQQPAGGPPPHTSSTAAAEDGGGGNGRVSAWGDGSEQAEHVGPRTTLEYEALREATINATVKFAAGARVLRPSGSVGGSGGGGSSVPSAAASSVRPVVSGGPSVASSDLSLEDWDAGLEEDHNAEAAAARLRHAVTAPAAASVVRAAAVPRVLVSGGASAAATAPAVSLLSTMADNEEEDEIGKGTRQTTPTLTQQQQQRPPVAAGASPIVSPSAALKQAGAGPATAAAAPGGPAPWRPQPARGSGGGGGGAPSANAAAATAASAAVSPPSPSGGLSAAPLSRFVEEDVGGVEAEAAELAASLQRQWGSSGAPPAAAAALRRGVSAQRTSNQSSEGESPSLPVSVGALSARELRARLQAHTATPGAGPASASAASGGAAGSNIDVSRLALGVSSTGIDRLGTLLAARAAAEAPVDGDEPTEVVASRGNTGVLKRPSSGGAPAAGASGGTARLGGGGGGGGAPDPFAALDAEEPDFLVPDPRAEALKSAQRDMLALADRLSPETAGAEPDAIPRICRSLIKLLRGTPSLRSYFVKAHGVLHLLDMLTACSHDPRCITWVLRVVNELCAAPAAAAAAGAGGGQGDSSVAVAAGAAATGETAKAAADASRLLESLAVVGILPAVMGFAAPEYPSPVRVQAAAFVEKLLLVGTSALQLLLVACGGVAVVVNLLVPSPSPPFVGDPALLHGMLATAQASSRALQQSRNWPADNDGGGGKGDSMNTYCTSSSGGSDGRGGGGGVAASSQGDSLRSSNDPLRGSSVSMQQQAALQLQQQQAALQSAGGSVGPRGWLRVPFDGGAPSPPQPLMTFAQSQGLFHIGSGGGEDPEDSTGEWDDMLLGLAPISIALAPGPPHATHQQQQQFPDRSVSGKLPATSTAGRNNNAAAYSSEPGGTASGWSPSPSSTGSPSNSGDGTAASVLQPHQPRTGNDVPDPQRGYSTGTALTAATSATAPLSLSLALSSSTACTAANNAALFGGTFTVELLRGVLQERFVLQEARLVAVAARGIQAVFQLQSATLSLTPNEFRRLFVRAGLIAPLARALRSTFLYVCAQLTAAAAAAATAATASNAAATAAVAPATALPSASPPAPTASSSLTFIAPHHFHPSSSSIPYSSSSSSAGTSVPPFWGFTFVSPASSSAAAAAAAAAPASTSSGWAATTAAATPRSSVSGPSHMQQYQYTASGPLGGGASGSPPPLGSSTPPSWSASAAASSGSNAGSGAPPAPTHASHGGHGHGSGGIASVGQTGSVGATVPRSAVTGTPSPATAAAAAALASDVAGGGIARNGGKPRLPPYPSNAVTAQQQQQPSRGAPMALSSSLSTTTPGAGMNTGTAAGGSISGGNSGTMVSRFSRASPRAAGFGGDGRSGSGSDSSGHGEGDDDDMCGYSDDFSSDVSCGSDGVVGMSSVIGTGGGFPRRHPSFSGPSASDRSRRHRRARRSEHSQQQQQQQQQQLSLQGQQRHSRTPHHHQHGLTNDPTTLGGSSAVALSQPAPPLVSPAKHSRVAGTPAAAAPASAGANAPSPAPPTSAAAAPASGPPVLPLHLPVPIRCNACVAANVDNLSLLLDVVVTCAQGDALVKVAVSSQPVVSTLLRMLRPAPYALLSDAVYQQLVLRVLKALKFISMEPVALEVLDAAGAIEVLVPILARCTGSGSSGAMTTTASAAPLSAASAASHAMTSQWGSAAGSMFPLSSSSPAPPSAQAQAQAAKEMQNYVLHTLFNLCRVNKARQERAALSGAIAPLMEVVEASRVLKPLALPLLCDFVHAGPRCRALLWDHRGVEFFCSCLAEPYFNLYVCNSLSAWASSDASRVQSVLVQPASLAALSDMFATSSVYIEAVLPSLTSMVDRCPLLAAALAEYPPFCAELVRRLGRPGTKAILFKHLLGLLRALFNAAKDRPRLVREWGLAELVKDVGARTADKVVLLTMTDALSRDFDAALAGYKRTQTAAMAAGGGGGGLGGPTSAASPAASGGFTAGGGAGAR